MRRALALVVLAALAACQDYQFSPVGRCLLHPGRVSVASLAAVDILFVVDDSLSMEKYQTNLANNLGTFIERLAQKQQARVNAGKEPFDIHIAVTSTSVLVNRYNASTGSYDVVNNYYNFVSTGSCTQGVLRRNGDPFPAGTFVAAGSNPRVLSFTRDLDWAHVGTDARIRDLIARFKQNVQVGSCGANQEMPFEAAKRAIEKGMAGQQGVEWPHANSKLAVIFMGNEDDCSTAPATQGGLVWDGQASTDACILDRSNQLTPYTAYRDFLVGLGRPVATAFVRPGFADCAAAGVSGTGARMKALASALNAAGGDVTAVEASVCGDFAGSLERIADELPPPDHLTLATTPVAADIMRLQVLEPDGALVHVCTGPDSAKEWWFVDCTTAAPLPAGQMGTCIQLKTSTACEPQAGQLLVAEYMARVPSSGCADEAQCASVLGGKAKEWTCEKSTGMAIGTCVCAGQ